MSTQTLPSPLAQPSFLELFTPKLMTVFREGYSFASLRADLMAGLTVAIVALPLSMAIAIGSHATPAQGLYTSIVGGFVVSALSGSRFQIGGPAGAFIVLVAATVQQHGMDGLILATILSGIMLMGIGYLRLGTYIKFIPYPVTVGFTAGIAVTIFSSEIKPLLGLSFSGAEPGPLLEKIPFLWSNLPTLSTAALSLSVREHRAVGGLALLAAALAGDADRRRLGRARDRRAETARRDHRVSVRRHSARPSAAGAAASQLGEDSGRAAQRDFVRAARRDRIAALCRGRRQHDRTTPSFQLRAGRSGGRQYRVGAVRRHLRHRDRGANRNER